jgi:hypothetical protein
MKIFLVRSDEARREMKTPFVGADHAVVEGACPECGNADFKVAGTGRRPSADDRAWEANAVALCCRKPAGIIRAEMDTLFGVREDEIVGSRCRVY